VGGGEAGLDAAANALYQTARGGQGANVNQDVFPVIRELTALLGRCGIAPEAA
jgi:hypothetical protein